MNILEKIVAHKRVEVETLKEVFPFKFLEQSIYFDSKSVSLAGYIKREDKNGIIAEFKRKSPSQGFINQFASVEQVSIAYMQAGASALSILTDKEFFAGTLEDLRTARKFNFCPILRKDFIIDEYQVWEAKSIGADAVLLIAAILDNAMMTDLAQKAHDLGMEVLIEAHDEDEVKRAVQANPDLIGINNRNLQNFDVSIDTSRKLRKWIPDAMVKISESGLRRPEDVASLKKEGFDGFLVGQHFMETNNPGKACERFINELNKIRVEA